MGLALSFYHPWKVFFLRTQVIMERLDKPKSKAVSTPQAFKQPPLFDVPND